MEENPLIPRSDMRRWLPIVILALLVACGSPEAVPTPGGAAGTARSAQLAQPIQGATQTATVSRRAIGTVSATGSSRTTTALTSPPGAASPPSPAAPVAVIPMLEWGWAGELQVRVEIVGIVRGTLTIQLKVVNNGTVGQPLDPHGFRLQTADGGAWPPVTDTLISAARTDGNIVPPSRYVVAHLEFDQVLPPGDLVLTHSALPGL